MDKINFQNGVTKVNADTFNTFQNNVEKSSVVVSPTQPATNEKVWFKKGKNLFNKNNFVSTESYINASNGKIEPYTGYTKMLILSIDGGNSYTISRTAGKHFRAGTTSSYPTNGVTVSNLKVNNTGTSITVTAGANDKYLVCSYYQQGLDTITATVIESSLQIESGSEASPYEAYIEPTVLVKNGNIFEEFIRNNEKEQIKTAVYINEFTNVSTSTNVAFKTMFPNLSLDKVICFNIEIVNVYETWDRVYANILRQAEAPTSGRSGELQIRSYASTQNVVVRVTAFYK